MLAEREKLLAEVNQWRAASAVPLPPREPSFMAPQLRDLAAVEHETFGAFPNGFGDNAPDDGSGDERNHEELGTIDAEAENSAASGPQSFKFSATDIAPDSFLVLDQPLDFGFLFEQPHITPEQPSCGNGRETLSILPDYEMGAIAASMPP